MVEQRTHTRPVARTLQRAAAEPGRYAFWTFGNLAINRFTGPLEARDIRLLTDLTANLARECGPFGSLNLVDPRVGLPDHGTRSALGDLTRRFGAELRYVGVVLEGTGFWSSALRSLSMTTALLSPVKFPLRFYASVGEASEQLPELHQARMGQPMHRGALTAALQDALE